MPITIAKLVRHSMTHNGLGLNPDRVRHITVEYQAAGFIRVWECPIFHHHTQPSTADLLFDDDGHLGVTFSVTGLCEAVKLKTL